MPPAPPAPGSAFSVFQNQQSPLQHHLWPGTTGAPFVDCAIDPSRTVLVVIPGFVYPDEKVANDLFASFCGLVVEGPITDGGCVQGKTVYICGDLQHLELDVLSTAARVFVVKDLSSHYDELPLPSVRVGQVPLLIHGVGVYIPEFFDPSRSWYQRIAGEHVFQSMTESTKPGTAHRTGVYLTKVQRNPDNSSLFGLLRCSSNLRGPTGNFGPTDHQIMDQLNAAAASLFQNPYPMNHVLAQTYHNTARTEDHKETKATIKEHADKTKDMPANGMMPFCTFYDRLDSLEKMSAYDYGRKGVSGLTKLHFRLKRPLDDVPGLASEFTITLYPNSVFFMPLTTNRLYTHEIRASALDARFIPTRIGYVVRCSSTMALHKPGEGTYLLTDSGPQFLGPPTPEGMQQLRELYARENASTDFIRYGTFLFSMNGGDYLQPILTESFRCLFLDIAGNPFDDLQQGVRFGNVTKGRKGQVLVQPDGRGVPLVRTTTKYDSPAQCFNAVHDTLARAIESVAGLHGKSLNNALIERYDKAYSTMVYHSDQALDVDPSSHIALYSCYQDLSRLASMRKLVVESKKSGEVFEIPLIHNSVVLFSLDTNTQYRHKIVLDDRYRDKTDNEWLGVTFRTSKTWVTFAEGSARLPSGKPLTIATEADCQTFYALRKQENETMGFEYPQGDAELTYTVSPSDIMPPISCGGEE